MASAADAAQEAKRKLTLAPRICSTRNKLTAESERLKADVKRIYGNHCKTSEGRAEGEVQLPQT
jgi:hypothetical protein